MTDWQVLLITGPAGAGKTTTARHFAATRPQPTLHLSLDDLRGSVLSGLANPVDGWDAEVARQYRLAQRSIGHTARLYVKSGFKVVSTTPSSPTGRRRTCRAGSRPSTVSTRASSSSYPDSTSSNLETPLGRDTAAWSASSHAPSTK
jgi:adenylylsulfate kinase-like enzyme